MRGWKHACACMSVFRQKILNLYIFRCLTQITKILPGGIGTRLLREGDLIASVDGQSLQGCTRHHCLAALTRRRTDNIHVEVLRRRHDVDLDDPTSSQHLPQIGSKVGSTTEQPIELHALSAAIVSDVLAGMKKVKSQALKEGPTTSKSVEEQRERFGDNLHRLKNSASKSFGDFSGTGKMFLPRTDRASERVTKMHAKNMNEESIVGLESPTSEKLSSNPSNLSSSLRPSNFFDKLKQGQQYSAFLQTTKDSLRMKKPITRPEIIFDSTLKPIQVIFQDEEYFEDVTIRNERAMEEEDISDDEDDDDSSTNEIPFTDIDEVLFDNNEDGDSLYGDTVSSEPVERLSPDMPEIKSDSVRRLYHEENISRTIEARGETLNEDFHYTPARKLLSEPETSASLKTSKLIQIERFSSIVDNQAMITNSQPILGMAFVLDPDSNIDEFTLVEDDDEDEKIESTSSSKATKTDRTVPSLFDQNATAADGDEYADTPSTLTSQPESAIIEYPGRPVIADIAVRRATDFKQNTERERRSARPVTPATTVPCSSPEISEHRDIPETHVIRSLGSDDNVQSATASKFLKPGDDDVTVSDRSVSERLEIKTVKIDSRQTAANRERYEEIHNNEVISTSEINETTEVAGIDTADTSSLSTIAVSCTLSDTYAPPDTAASADCFTPARIYRPAFTNKPDKTLENSATEANTRSVTDTPTPVDSSTLAGKFTAADTLKQADARTSPDITAPADDSAVTDTFSSTDTSAMANTETFTSGDIFMSGERFTQEDDFIPEAACKPTVISVRADASVSAFASPLESTKLEEISTPAGTSTQAAAYKSADIAKPADTGTPADTATQAAAYKPADTGTPADIATQAAAYKPADTGTPADFDMPVNKITHENHGEELNCFAQEENTIADAKTAQEDLATNIYEQSPTTNLAPNEIGPSTAIYIASRDCKESPTIDLFTNECKASPTVIDLFTNECKASPTIDLATNECKASPTVIDLFTNECKASPIIDSATGEREEGPILPKTTNESERSSIMDSTTKTTLTLAVNNLGTFSSNSSVPMQIEAELHPRFDTSEAIVTTEAADQQINQEDATNVHTATADLQAIDTDAANSKIQDSFNLDEPILVASAVEPSSDDSQFPSLSPAGNISQLQLNDDFSSPDSDDTPPPLPSDSPPPLPTSAPPEFDVPRFFYNDDLDAFSFDELSEQTLNRMI